MERHGEWREEIGMNEVEGSDRVMEERRGESCTNSDV